MHAPSYWQHRSLGGRTWDAPAAERRCGRAAVLAGCRTAAALLRLYTARTPPQNAHTPTAHLASPLLPHELRHAPLPDGLLRAGQQQVRQWCRHAKQQGSCTTHTGSPQRRGTHQLGVGLCSKGKGVAGAVLQRQPGQAGGRRRRAPAARAAPRSLGTRAAALTMLLLLLLLLGGRLQRDAARNELITDAWLRLLRPPSAPGPV